MSHPPTLHLFPSKSFSHSPLSSPGTRPLLLLWLRFAGTEPAADIESPVADGGDRRRSGTGICHGSVQRRREEARSGGTERARVLVPFDLGVLRAKTAATQRGRHQHCAEYTQQAKNVIEEARSARASASGMAFTVWHFGFRFHVLLPFPLSIGIISIHIWARGSARRQALDWRQKTRGASGTALRDGKFATEYPHLQARRKEAVLVGREPGQRGSGEANELGLPAIADIVEVGKVLCESVRGGNARAGLESNIDWSIDCSSSRDGGGLAATGGGSCGSDGEMADLAMLASVAPSQAEWGRETWTCSGWFEGVGDVIGESVDGCRWTSRATTKGRERRRERDHASLQRETRGSRDHAAVSRRGPHWTRSPAILADRHRDRHWTARALIALGAMAAGLLIGRAGDDTGRRWARFVPPHLHLRKIRSIK
ncbi:hypothetical protein DFH11DRAFT_1544284 [Phellopilus nigrolimitatus]|nr:hypothetical protein DFH11DRAFT_1544284 [Phellopilus nigrolimitatus]